MKMIITRQPSSDKQTLGEMSVLNDQGEQVFTCKTLKLPGLDNQRSISCIPTGSYVVKGRYSEKFKQHFNIQDVPDRTWTLIPPRNFYTQIQGCVLVGAGFSDINNDGYLDVADSRSTMAKLLEIMPDEFQLTVL